MTWNIAALILYTVLAGAGLSLFYRYKRANPVFWFLILQWIIAAGTLAIVDLEVASERAYALLFFAALLSFLVGAIASFFGLRVSRSYHAFWQRPVEADSQFARLCVYGLFMLSIVVTAIYYQAVGYNLFQQIVQGAAVDDFTSARLAAYSGAEYFAPGYVNQFKNVLLPLTLSVIAVWAWHAQRRVFLALAVVFGVPITVWALLGTGQRGFLVYAFAAFLFGMASIIELRLGRVLLMVIGVGALFGLLSYHLGRIEELTIVGVVLQILARMFVDEQSGSLAGFRHVFEMDTAWFSEWAIGFLGLLPGHPGSDLDHQLFALIHGTTRGTATLSTVGSVYHNGGIVGVLVIYLAMGWLYMSLYHRFLLGRKTVLRCFTYGAIFFYLAFFVAGTPVGLVNKGLVTLGIVLGIRKLCFVSKRPTSSSFHSAELGAARLREGSS